MMGAVKTQDEQRDEPVGIPMSFMSKTNMPPMRNPEVVAQPDWTLWNEAHSMCSALKKVADFSNETANLITSRLHELRRMMGEMAKRP